MKKYEDLDVVEFDKNKIRETYPKNLHVIRKTKKIDSERAKYVPEGRFIRSTKSGLKNNIFPDKSLHMGNIDFQRYHRLPRDRVSWTVMPNWYDIRHKIHYKKNRPYSIRECAELQTFSDDFEFKSKNIIKIYQMIGNAVPPLLGKKIAEEINEVY